MSSAPRRRRTAWPSPAVGTGPRTPPPPSPVVMRTTAGELLPFDIARCHGPSTDDDHLALEAVPGPVIDLGCGPGRLVLSLARRRVPALGVDSSPEAVALARSRGASVLLRDVFGPLPGEGRWETALLFDGNIGIGGDPSRLLHRCRSLLGRHGQLVVEVDPRERGMRRVVARLERDEFRTRSFPWAVVGRGAIAKIATTAGFSVAHIAETPSRRCFARLRVAST